jgi:hypothetical protein
MTPTVADWVAKILKLAVGVGQSLQDVAEALDAKNGAALAARQQELQGRFEDFLDGHRGTVIPQWQTPNLALNPSWLRHFFRLAVALDTVVGITAARLGVVLPAVTAADVPTMEHFLLPRTALPDKAWGRLFTEQCDDLVEIVRVCARQTTNGTGFEAEIFDRLRRANKNLGRWPLSNDLSYDAVGDIWQNVATEDWVATELFGANSPENLKKVRQKAERLAIISVDDWDRNTRLYPTFQFAADSRSVVQTVLRHLPKVSPRQLRDGVDHPFCGWRLAIWLYVNASIKGRGVGFFQEALDAIGLWQTRSRGSGQARDKLSLEPVASAVEDGCLPETLMPAGTVYYRVGQAKWQEHPYHYSRASGPHPGRYDPADRPLLGALYLGEDAEGCWAEVLDREPVVTLGYVASRCVSELRVRKDDHGETPRLADLVHQHGRLLTAPRGESQEVAQMVSDQGRFGGIRYALRSMPTHHGVVVFGHLPSSKDPEGPDSHPERRGIKGQWQVVGTQSWNDSEALWNYLDYARSGRLSTFPVILRHLPDDPPVRVGSP